MTLPTEPRETAALDLAALASRLDKLETQASYDELRHELNALKQKYQHSQWWIAGLVAVGLSLYGLTLGWFIPSQVKEAIQGSTVKKTEEEIAALKKRAERYVKF